MVPSRSKHKCLHLLHLYEYREFLFTPRYTFIGMHCTKNLHATDRVGVSEIQRMTSLHPSLPSFVHPRKIRSMLKLHIYIYLYLHIFRCCTYWLRGLLLIIQYKKVCQKIKLATWILMFLKCTRPPINTLRSSTTFPYSW